MNYFNYEDCLLLIPDLMKDPENFGFDVVSKGGGIGIVHKQGIDMSDLRNPKKESSEDSSRTGVNDWVKTYGECCWYIDKQNAIDVTAEEVTEEK